MPRVWNGTRSSSTAWPGSGGRLEGEHEPADQPEGENEQGERAYRLNHGIAGTLTPTEVLSM